MPAILMRIPTRGRCATWCCGRPASSCAQTTTSGCWNWSRWPTTASIRPSEMPFGVPWTDADPARPRAERTAVLLGGARRAAPLEVGAELPGPAGRRGDRHPGAQGRSSSRSPARCAPDRGSAAAISAAGWAPRCGPRCWSSRSTTSAPSWPARTAFTDNPASLRVSAKLGYRHDGTTTDAAARQARDPAPDAGDQVGLRRAPAGLVTAGRRPGRRAWRCSAVVIGDHRRPSGVSPGRVRVEGVAGWPGRRTGSRSGTTSAAARSCRG